MGGKNKRRRNQNGHAAVTVANAGRTEPVQVKKNGLPEIEQRVRDLESQLAQKEDNERQLQERLHQLIEQLQKQQTSTFVPDVETASHIGQNDLVGTEPEIEKRQKPWRSFPTCCRCHQLTSDLKLFPCIHGCCSACLDQLRQASTIPATGETGVINCPECDQRATGVLSDSPANRYVVKLTKSIAPRDDGLTMSRCSWGNHETTDGDHVTQYCYECGIELCSGCVVKHSWKRFAACHFVVPIEDMLPLEGDANCKKHGGQPVSIYCVSCKITGCLQCLGSHRQHLDQCKAITDLAEDSQKEVKELVEGLCSEMTRCEKKLIELNDHEKVLRDNVEKVKSDIQNQYRGLLEWINSIRDSLHKKVENFEEQSARDLKSIRLATKRQLEVTIAIEQFSQKVLEIGKHCQMELACFHMNLSKEAWTWPTEVLQMALPKKISFHPVYLRSLVPDDERCVIGKLLDEDQRAERFATWTEMKTQLEKVSQERQQLEEMTSGLEQNVKKLVESNENFENQVKEKDELISAQEESIDDLKKRMQEDEQELNGLIEEKTAAQNQITELEREISALQRMNEELDSQKTSVENNLTTKQTELKKLSQLAQNDKEEFNTRLSELQSAVQQAASRERQLESRLEHMESVSCRLQSDIAQAVDRERRLKVHLDQLLTEQAPPKLVPVGRIPDTDVRGLPPVYGVATLNGKLYVLCMGSCYLKIYDSDTFLLLSEILIPGLLDAIDMTSCVTNRCIYIADGRSNKVHSIEATACNTDVGSYVRRKWITTVDGPRGLSVTPIECHLLVTCATEPNQLMVFNADGKRLKTIPVDVGGSIRHSVLLPSGQLLVCFCAGPGDIGGICHVTQDGVVKQKLSLDNPYHLAVDSVHNDVYVADFDGRRVLLLHRDLADMSEPVKNEDGEYNEAQLINQPLRLCLDKDNKRLYVAECGGRISVYAVNETRTTVDVPSQR